MAPLKKIYLEELARIQDRINSLFEQALLPSEYEDREGGLPGTWAPAVDVIETEDSYLLFAELAGIRKEDIQLNVRDRRLELSGRRQTLGENHNFVRMERSYGPFRRTFDLGVPVDIESITAGFEAGILRIHVPKRAEAAPGVTRVPVNEE
ncbi:MAG TPA: Hsp20/alpha crystallin family protein [Thermoanaerobaculia bacterium]|jgi:HSP20 family protein|nr:Hsp20/alpha crystallin family protein [Thermoanaerobaculia bacterium]